MQCSSNFTIVDKVSWGNILQNQCKKHKQSQNRRDLGKTHKKLVQHKFKNENFSQISDKTEKIMEFR